MPNNRAAASPKSAPCRFEELMRWQLTEDDRKVQRMRPYRRPCRTASSGKGQENKWRDAAPREGGLMHYLRRVMLDPKTWPSNCAS
jgi:hypothetical protein